MTTPVLELRDVWWSRRGQPILEGIDLRVEAGDFLALLGPNGCGKTSLLRVVLGLVTPDRGEVRVLGTTPRGARGRIGYVPQQAHFDPDFPIRVRDVVRMGRLGPGLDRARDAAVVDAQLERLEIADLAGRPIGALSGGQRQRVLIARALAMEPELLLLDEPTASLDERIGQGVWEGMEDLARERTVIVVSHDVGAVIASVKSVACLNRRLFMHESRKLTADLLAAAYGESIELVSHQAGHAAEAGRAAGTGRAARPEDAP